MASSRRLVLFIAALVAGTLLATSVASAAFSSPILLRQAGYLRVRDIASKGHNVAVGWQEGKDPGSLWVRISTDGGIDFRTRYAVVGLGSLGMSLAICGRQVWAVSAARYPGDADTDSDLLLSRRGLRGGASQLFLTQPGTDHAVRSPDIACVGNRLLAIAWLDRTSAGTRAYLLLRDLAGLLPAATSRRFDLGPARFKTGISVEATDAAAYVAWVQGTDRDLRFKRFGIGDGTDPDITPFRTVTRARGGVVQPRLAARSDRVLLVYTDDGQLKSRLSLDEGQTFAAAQVLIQAGRPDNPSRATSADLRGSRFVVEALRPPPGSPSGDPVPYRLQSTNDGATWSRVQLGNRGFRVGALRVLSGGGSRLLEAWHDDGPTIDVVRFQREIP